MVVPSPWIISISLLAQWAAAQTVTAPGFMGFTEIRSNYYSEHRCKSDLSFGTYLDFVGCLSSTNGASTGIVINCVSGIYTFGDGDIATCSTRTASDETTPAGWRNCHTQLYYEQVDDATALRTQYYCARDAETDTIIRTLPSGAVYITDGGDVPQTLPGSTTAHVAVQTTSQYLTSSDEMGGDNETLNGGQAQDGWVGSNAKRRSKAWIAGAVVGAVAFLFLLIFVILAFLRHRKKLGTAAGNQNWSGQLTGPSQPWHGSSIQSENFPQSAPMAYLPPNADQVPSPQHYHILPSASHLQPAPTVHRALATPQTSWRVYEADTTQSSGGNSTRYQ